MRDIPTTPARRALTAAASLVLIGLIIGAQSLIPSSEEQTEPIAYSGEIGATVDARRFTIEVDKVQFAHNVYDSTDYGDTTPIEANGIWVVAWATLTSTRDTLTTVTAELDTGGDSTYAASTWLFNAYGGIGSSLGPGIPTYGAFVFELPEERLVDPTLQVGVARGPGSRLQAQADIHLGLGGDALAARIDAAEESVPIPPIETR
ncbi:hypothetical protein GCM10009799_47630 [Nocardiopsis rhodophaea]|uniref:DUF4352 domain-containing protein n=1 Tax=Nocardiopsis rhodophaea TaxID=280238 RepID=A0ABN2TM82_9ACTN